MVNTTEIRAGRAFVELFADDSKLARGLRAAQAKLKAFGKSVRAMGTKLMGIGAAITAPLIAAAKATADSGAALWDISQRTGMSAESLSALGFAAEMTGADMESLEKGVRRMQKSIAGVADQAEGTTGSLAHLGLTAKDLVGLAPDEQFALIAARLRQIPDATQRAAAAMKVFGRSGTELLPMIDRLDALTDAARQMGFVRSTASVEAAKEFSVTLKLAAKAAKSLSGALGSAMMPLLKEWAMKLLDITLMARNWIKENKGLVVSVFKLALGVMAAGAGLVVLGSVIKGLAWGIGVLVTAVHVFHAVLAAGAAVVGAILTPLGITITAVAALGAVVLYASGAAGKALDWLRERFDSLASDAKAAWGAIGKALASGDIGLAAKVLWLTLKMEWARGTTFLQDTWLAFKGWFLTASVDLFSKVGRFMVNFASDFQKLCAIISAGVKGLFEDAVDWSSRKLNEWASGAMYIANSIRSKFDKSFDLDAANREVDAGEREVTKGLDAEHSRRQQEITSQRDQYLIENEKARLADQQGITNTMDDLRKALEAERKAAATQNEADIAAARAAWEAAIREANALPAPGGAGGGPPGGAIDPHKFLNDAKIALDGVADLVSQGPQGFVRGTFNAAALQGLAVEGTAAERTAKATEETAKQCKNIKRAVDDSKPKFT